MLFFGVHRVSLIYGLVFLINSVNFSLIISLNIVFGTLITCMLDLFTMFHMFLKFFLYFSTFLLLSLSLDIFWLILQFTNPFFSSIHTAVEPIY